MAAPRPIPTKLKLLRGNPGKRPLNKLEPQPAAGMPARPTHIKGEALREWNRLAPELERLGILTQIDGAALAAYCEAYGRWVAGVKGLKHNGLINIAGNGHPMPNPYLGIINHALSQMRAFMVEFGLTPSSRTRLKVEPQKEDDQHKRFFG